MEHAEAARQGAIVGSLTIVAIVTACLFKSLEVTRRPTANRKCLIAMDLVLAGLLPVTIYSALGSDAHPWRFISAGFMTLLSFVGGCLAILGLVEFRRNGHSYVEGRGQAVAALVVGVAYSIMSWGSALKAAGSPGEGVLGGRVIRQEDRGFSFEVPGTPWVRLEPPDPMICLQFTRPSPEIAFVMTEVSLSPGDPASLEDFVGEGKANLKAAGVPHRVLEEGPEMRGRMKGWRISLDLSRGGLRVYVRQWLGVRNGRRYQLTVSGEWATRSEVDAEAGPMFDRVAFLPQQVP